MSSKQTDPRLEGYRKWEGFDPFEEHCGPFYFRQETGGAYRCAFIAEQRHMNGQGAMHGGAMMTFADYVMFVVARPALENARAVTVTYNSEFTAAAATGEFVEGTGEIVRETGALVFVRGILYVGDRTIMNFSGVIKKVRAAAQS
jgi:acyl-coenzyme A thioesterase PaaI-like protein